MPFGGGPSERRSPFFSERGEDVADRLEVTLEEAFHGARRQLQLAIPKRRPDGRVERQQRTLNVPSQQASPMAGASACVARAVPEPATGKPATSCSKSMSPPHAIYGLDGRDVTLSLPVAPWEAALGATVKTPTLKGEVDLRIPPGSATGTKLRLRGRAYPAVRRAIRS